MKISAAFGLVTFLLVGSASAEPQVTATYRPVEAGYRLDFTVRAGEYSVYRWGFDRIDDFDVAAPTGWNGLVFTRYTDWTAISTDNELLPGQFLFGCAATFPDLPTQIDYFVSQGGVGGAYYDTLLPTPIPEPSSLLALVGCLAGWGSLRLRRRKG
ncbi:MAG: PEP-CTERM sorting domain-containing protein [Armatimonadota bacterium]|nr:PEP-CTERM sorting domain-containing protein [Armatimonadota bacterium]